MEMVSTTSLVKVEMLATTSAATTPEKVREDVIKLHIVELLAATSTLAITLLMLSNSLFSLLVINATLLLIGKSLVSIGNLLEFFLGCLGVVLVLVWMVPNGKLFKGFLNLLF